MSDPLIHKGPLGSTSKRRYLVSGAIHIVCEMEVLADSEEGAIEAFEELPAEEFVDRLIYRTIDREPIIVEEVDD